MNDPYRILGVSQNASAEEIKSAYKSLVKKYHPDKGGDARKFAEIQEAYDILKNPSNKSHQSGHQSGQYEYNFGSQFDFKFDDIFEHIFPNKNMHDASIKIEVSITLNEAYRGTTSTIEYYANKSCNICDGKGYKNNSDIGICLYCNGAGYTSHGFLQIACNHCHGNGKVIKNYCKTCSGKGVYSEKSSISVQIPPGVDDGQRIQVQGHGHASRHGTGDLYIIIKIKTHNIFTRKGYDLYCSHSISCIQAMLGTEISVPNILGNILRVNIPSGIQPNTKITMNGEGMNINGRKGNLYIEIKITIPTNLSPKQKDLLSLIKAG